jgi:hypothetical protein
MRRGRAPVATSSVWARSASGFDAEEVDDRGTQPVLEEDGVHPVLERGALAHQKEAEAGPLPLRPHGRVGQPDLRDKIAAGELGQNPRVDPIRLTGKRRQALHPLRIGDPHIPARQLEPVVDKTSTRHRLDRCEYRALLAVEAANEVSEPVAIRRARTDRRRLAIDQQRVPVETLATEVKSDTQHAGASFR